MQATKLQQYLTNSLQKRKLVSIVKKDKNRSLLHKVAGSIEA
jgi:hypothetical protein